MQEPYKRILEKRRSQIVEQVRWSRELAVGLEKYGLLSKEDLRYAETEQNSHSRVYCALTRIIGSDESRAFEKFRLLLDELGNKSMAESLDFDRQRIRWEFDKEIKATSLPNYIDLLSARLLDVALTEQDDYTRQSLITVAKRRLEDLRNCIRQQQRDRDNFRAGLWEAITGRKLSWSSFSYVTKGSTSLSEIEDAESTRDETLLKKTKSLVELLRSSVVELNREHESWLETLHNNNILPNKALLTVSAKQRANIDLFANVREEEVAQIQQDDLQIDEHFDHSTDDEKFVRINRSVFDQILNTLKPFESPRPFSPKQKGDVTGDAVDPSVSKLINLLQSMEAELQLWRNRSQWLSAEVKSLEHDHQLISTAVGLPSSNPAADRKVRLENILGKIADLTSDDRPTKTDGETHDPSDDDDETADQFLDDGKSRRSSVNDGLASSRRKNETTVVGIGGARSRRMSAPFMRSRPSISTALPPLNQPHKNRNAYTYRNSSRDNDGSYSIATSTRSGPKMAGKFVRQNFDLNYLHQRTVDVRPLAVITAEPLAVLTSQNNRQQKMSIVGHRSSID